MTIAQILSKIKAKLGPSGDMLGAEVLLAYVLKKKREDFLVHPEEEISSELEQQFRQVFERFLAGEPVAYLTHFKEFYGLDFYVDERVLIPRPETELLVEKIILSFGNSDDARLLRILDVGTGSGCIAVALAKHIPCVSLMATDISAEALEVAGMNAEKHEVSKKIQFLQSDLLEEISKDAQFEVIVANLPYIGKEKFNFVAKNVEKYEPNVALFGGEDGLRLYEKLFQQICDRSWKFEMLCGEFGFLQNEELQKLCRRFFPDRNLEIFEDYAKIERIFTVT